MWCTSEEKLSNSSVNLQIFWGGLAILTIFVDQLNLENVTEYQGASF